MKAVECIITKTLLTNESFAFTVNTLYIVPS